jgi:lysophospholipase L1-like esterase
VPEAVLKGISGAILSVAAALLCGCDLIKTSESPTSPSVITPPAPAASIHYTAIGASDANGVGSSVPCLPFTPCEDGTGYVPVAARQLRASREVTVMNLGIPASVLSPAVEAIARQIGREVTGNFVDRQMPFVPTNSTLVSISGGVNDANAIGEAIEKGAAATAGVATYIETQARAFGADYNRLIQGVRNRARSSFIVVLNVPNVGAMPNAAQYPVEHRRVLQAVSVAFSREANRQAGPGIAVLDLMCDPALYAPANFARDGFHPNDAGYAHIATRLAAIINGAASMPAAACAAMTAVPAG